MHAVHTNIMLLQGRPVDMKAIVESGDVTVLSHRQHRTAWLLLPPSLLLFRPGCIARDSIPSHIHSFYPCSVVWIIRRVF